MPMYCYNPRLRKVWNERIRRINRIFKAIEQEQAGPHIRIAERG